MNTLEHLDGLRLSIINQHSELAELGDAYRVVLARAERLERELAGLHVQVEAERDELRAALRGLMQWVEDNTREAERLLGHWPPNWRDLQALVEGDTDD